MLNKKKRFLTHMLFIFIFIIINYYILADFQHSFFSSSITPFNDEVFYLKQIESIHDYGMPKGYFGYNLSSAKHFTFGTWPPFLLYFYALITYPFQSFNNMVMFSNVFVVLLFYSVIVAFVVKKQFKMRDYYYLLFPLLSIMVTRMIFSGMSEAPFLLLGILTFFSLELSSKNKLIISLIISIFAIMKPHVVIFILFIMINDKKITKNKILIYLSLIVLSIFSFFAITNSFTAEYLFESTKFKEIGEILSGDNIILSIVNFFFGNLYSTLLSVFTNNVYSISSMIYISYFITLVLIFINILVKINKKTINRCDLSVLALYISAFLIIINLYIPNPASRLILVFVIFGWIYLLREKNKAITLLLFVCVFISNILLKVNGSVDLFINDDKINSEVKYSLNSLILQDDIKENTIVIDYDSLSSLYPYLYGVPSGFGLNIAYDYIILRDSNKYNYEYILVQKGSNLVESLNKTYESFIDNDVFVLLKLRN